jgi:hypothetical protein
MEKLLKWLPKEQNLDRTPYIGLAIATGDDIMAVENSSVRRNLTLMQTATQPTDQKALITI